MFAIFQALEELCTCSRCCQDALSHRLCVDFVTFTSNLSRGGQRCAAWALLTVSHVTGVLCLFSLPLGSSQSISVAQNCRGLMMAQTVKRLPTMRETQVQSPGQEDPLEKEMATHSSTLAWKTPWMEERDRLQSMGLQSQTRLHFHFQCHPKENLTNGV